MLSRPPRFKFSMQPERGYFESRLLASSPLSPTDFTGLDTLDDLNEDLITNLWKMKEITLHCLSGGLTKQNSSTQIADFPPPSAAETSVGLLVQITSSIYARCIQQKIPFAHQSNANDRLDLFDSLCAIPGIEQTFRHMPGVLVWILLVALATSGVDGWEHRFLLPVLHRWCLALSFCTNAAAVVELLERFASVDGIVRLKTKDVEEHTYLGTV